jgi:hypothetical protein
MALRLVPDLNFPHWDHGLTTGPASRTEFPLIGYKPKAMPIRPFLAGQAFEPEVIREMSLALETVCGKFNLALSDDPATRLVASKIIELAQRGVRDAATLTAMTIKEFKHS